MYQINTNHTTFNNKIVKVLKTSIVELNEKECNKTDSKNGEVIEISKDGIIVKCAQNALKIITLKPEGKGEMNARDWYNGLKK